MLTSAEDALKVIFAPPAGAGEVRATLQIEDDCGLMVAGLHENPFKPGRIDSMPPVTVIDRDVALLSAALPPMSCSDACASGGAVATVRDTTATAPLVIGVLFRPQATQVAVPEPEVLSQEIDLFAAVAPGPAVTLTAEKSAAG